MRWSAHLIVLVVVVMIYRMIVVVIVVGVSVMWRKVVCVFVMDVINIVRRVDVLRGRRELVRGFWWS